MSNKNSDYPKDWLRIAEKDYSRVEKLLKIEDPEAAGFYLQQAVEKYLKAFLLSKGWRLKRTHDLEPLLNEMLKYDSTVEEYRPVCQRISGFYFMERYPLYSHADLTQNDVKASLQKVEGLLAIIRRRIV
jgi:HEPN domain-containing protein